MTCPVLGGCYRRLQRHHFDDPEDTPTFVSYDDLMPEWEELGEMIQRDTPQTSAQRLRAFYALEAVYFFLIPLGHYPTDEIDIKYLFQVQRKRDEGGLTHLIDTCETAKRELVIRAGHAQLMGKQNRPALSLVHSSMVSMGRVVGVCQDIATALRGALRGRDKELDKAGRLFGDELVLLKSPMTRSMEYLRTMLSINLDNPVSPWNQTNRFQV